MKWRISLIFVAVSAWHADSVEPGVANAVQRSVEANAKDWNAAPDYAYFETDRQKTGRETYEVLMILGSPYYRLVEINGSQLSAERQREEQRKLQETVARRESESIEERAKRVSQYEKDRHRDHVLMDQLTKAFDFTLTGEQKIAGYDVYALRATPKPGYRPPNIETHVLTGMEGTLWIDRKTFQWVKVVAEVIHPVSIEGFLAQVQPGTRFELEKRPVGNGIWLPSHFAMTSRSRILFLFSHKAAEDETYFGYQKMRTSALD